MSYSDLAGAFYPAHENNYQVGRSSQRICKITPHIMAGVLTAQQCAGIFQNPNRIASSNYGIGVDGEIACYVEEENRSYCSSSYENDNQAITIECSNNAIGGDWTISDATYNSLVNLCVDVCKRHNFRLYYDGTSDGSLTRHNMFAKTSCPGAYLTNRLSELAQKVNAILDGGAATSPTAPTTGAKYGSGTPVTYTGLWTQAQGGEWYPKDNLAVKEGVISKVVDGVAHPYLISDGIGWANDQCIDDEPSVPGGTAPVVSTPSPAGEKYGLGTPVCVNRIWTQSNGGQGYDGDWSGTITDVVPGAEHPYLINNGTGWTNDVAIDSDPHAPR